MTDCMHSKIEPIISSISSIMCIRIDLWGFKCLDCGKQWDLGNAVEAFKRVDRLVRMIDGFKATEEKYSQLIREVATKHPGETRHETALRYIKEREISPTSSVASSEES